MHHRNASDVLSVPSIFLTRSTFSASSSVSFAALTVAPALFCGGSGSDDLPGNEVKSNLASTRIKKMCFFLFVQSQCSELFISSTGMQSHRPAGELQLDLVRSWLKSKPNCERMQLLDCT